MIKSVLFGGFMYNHIFKYLNEVIIDKNIMIYGKILPEELKELSSSNQNISIVDDNLDNLIKLKKEFPDFEYNQSLYFIKKKFDFLILLTNSPITPKDYISKLGVFINIEFINSEEDYHKLILTKKRKDFEFLERVNLYKKEVVLSLLNSKSPKVVNNSLFSETPDIIIEFYSDFKLDLENLLKLL